MRSPDFRRAGAGLGLLIGLLALVLQAWLTIPSSMAAGRSLAASWVFYFSYFTILTNLLVVVIYAAQILPNVAALGVFRQAGVVGFGLPAILLVMAVFHFLLAPLGTPEGAWWVAERTLHYVTPVLFALWWALFAADGTLRYDLLARWLIAPIIYAVYGMSRGALTGEYPYHVINADELGYAQAFANIALLIVAFVCLGAVTIFVDALLGRLRGAPA